MLTPPPAGPIGLYYPDAAPPQQPADVAVVMPTVIRPIIREAVESIYAQDFAGRIHLLIGVDVPEGDRAMLEALLARRGDRISALVLELPYSTATRHGGLHNPADGGALRAMLTLAANSRRLAFLDDDNLWLPDHLRRLVGALGERTYAYSQRMLVDDETGRDLGVDVWHSTGRDSGRYAETGGFVDPNCLIVDKVKLAHQLSQWAQTWTGQSNGWGADKRFFASFRAKDHAAVPRPTVRYRIRRDNVLYRLATGQPTPSP